MARVSRWRIGGDLMSAIIAVMVIIAKCVLSGGMITVLLAVFSCSGFLSAFKNNILGFDSSQTIAPNHRLRQSQTVSQTRKLQGLAGFLLPRIFLDYVIWVVVNPRIILVITAVVGEDSLYSGTMWIAGRSMLCSKALGNPVSSLAKTCSGGAQIGILGLEGLQLEGLAVLSFR